MAKPRIVSGVLARVLLPTFAEMREWEKPPTKGKKLQRLTDDPRPAQNGN